MFSIYLQLPSNYALKTTLKLHFRSMCSKNALRILILFSLTSGTFCTRTSIQRCDSQDCKELTENIAASINRNVKPCDNFYEHACGHWSKSHPAPYSTHIWNNPHIVNHKVWFQLKDLLDNVRYENTNTLESKAKMAYDVCNNLDEIEKNGIKFLLAVTEDMGGWPMITPQSERIKTTYSWQTVHVTYGGLTGDGCLITTNVEEDPLKNNKPTLYLDQPKGLFKGLNCMDTTEDEIKYEVFVKTVAEVFIAEQNKAAPDKETLNKDIDKLLKFRKRLKEIMTSGQDTRTVKKVYSYKTIMDLQDWNANLNKKSKSATIHWKSFIETTIEFSRNIEITDKENVIVHDKDYMANLLILLAETAEEVVVNHMHLCFVEKHLKYTNRNMRSLISTVRDENEDIDGENRWVACISNHPMRHVLSRMYVKKHFPDARRREVKDLVYNLQTVIIEEIERSPWLSKGVKQNAVKKMESIDFMFGYPDWYDKPKLMADYYEGQDVSDVYLFNVLSYERMKYRREIEILSPVNFRAGSGYPAEVDMAYVTSTNSLEIPAAVLQPPLFSEDVPDVIRYATTGYLLAHELSHALDPQGRMYDEHGTKKDWWDKQTLASYKKRVNCITDIYTDLPIKELQKIRPHLRTNGVFTVNEDFSDILGLDIAFKAYKRTRSGEKGDVSINVPAFKGLSEDEIFFYANSQMHCESIDNDGLIDQLENDEHSISRFRVNIPFSNLAEFSTTFSCPANSFMNFKSKCHIWDK